MDLIKCEHDLKLRKSRQKLIRIGWDDELSLTRPDSIKKICECKLTYKRKMSTDAAKQEGEVKIS